MAEGKQIGGAQRGIAFSTGSALAVSVLILIVGAGANSQVAGGGFKILQLVPVIREQLGEVGVVIFALGFIAAALSSMLTVPLGAALTADSVFSEMPEKKMEPVGTDNPNFSDEQGVVQQQGNKEKAAVVEMEMTVDQEGKRLPRWIYLGIMFVMVAISTVVIAANGESENFHLMSGFYEMSKYLQRTAAWSSLLLKSSTAASSPSSPSASSSASTTPSSWPPPPRRVGPTSSSSSPSPSPSSSPAM